MFYLKKLLAKPLNIVTYRSLVTNAKNVVRPLILGIETSCDDTGAAIVDSTGWVLGEFVHSQQSTHLKYGGIIPPIAQDLHRQNIVNVIDETCRRANIGLEEVDAIAVTNRPGLPLSLQIGVRYAKHLARKYGKPIIPVHHMEAHALTARMEHKIEYPFLTLLCSGGHCLLAYVKQFDQFYLLGESLDDAPGEALDKTARLLKLRNLSEYEWLSGGAAIEKAAGLGTDTSKFEFGLPLARQKDCMFSFAGMKNKVRRHIMLSEIKHQLHPDEVIPDHPDLCLAFLKAITRHIAHRTQRAIEYCEQEKLFENNTIKSLVISGGCACNEFLYTGITQMAEQFGFETIRPSKKYCTDNGVMIAWNGIERFINNSDVKSDFGQIEINGRCKFGVDWSDRVKDAAVNCKWAKIPILRSYNNPSLDKM